MGNAAQVITGPDGVAWGDWTRRSRTYRDLGALLHGTDSLRSAHIAELLTAECECVRSPHLTSDDVRDLGVAAIASLEDPDCDQQLRAEWVRLFGETEFEALKNAIAPCESVYIAESREAHSKELVSIYEEMGFDWRPALTTHCDCPGHVAVEFLFMAYVLDRADSGDEKAAWASADFLTKHILSWVPLYAAALQNKVHHPVMRFVALATERFMCCEARRTGRSHPAQA